MTPEQQAAVEQHISEKVAVAIRLARPKWYEMNASQMTTVFVVLFGAVVSVGWFQRDLQDLIVWRGETNVRIDDILRDRHEGNRKAALFEHSINGHETRLQKVEDVRERLGVIEEKLSTVQQMLKEARDGKKPL